MFLPHPRVKVSIAGSLRDREVACSASDRQGSNFEPCVWRTVSSQSSHDPQEVLLAQFSLYVHKGGLNPDSFHFISLPHYFNSITVTHNRDIHQYNTRQRNNLLVPNIQHEFARKCIRNQIYVLLNNSPKTIVDKINTHSLKGFSTYIKKYLIDGYKLGPCTVYNCYTCNRP